MNKEKFAIGTVCGYEVSLEGEALELYRKMTTKQQDNFTTDLLHTLFHQIRTLRGKYNLSFSICRFEDKEGEKKNVE